MTPSSFGEGKPLRVLFVEDSEDDMLLIVRALEKSRYRPSFLRVETADAMKRALVEDEWDLIISDYFIPGFGGCEALRLYGESGLDVPFLVISGSIGEECAVEAMRSGACDYLMKDRLIRLGAAVERELREAEIRRERRRVETDLARATRQVSAILESISDTFFSTDAEFRIVYVNPAGERYLSRPRAGMVGRLFWDECPPGLWRSLRPGLEHAMTQRVALVQEAYDADSDRWLEVRGYPAPEGGLTIYWQDITERRQIQELQRNEREWLEAVLDLLPAPLLFVEPDTARVTFANRAANLLMEGVFQQTQSAGKGGELYRCYDETGALLPPERMPRFRAARGERLQGVQVSWEVAGELRPILINADILPAMHGHSAVCLMTFEDISGLKRVEADLRASNDALRLSNAELEQFAFAASHDLQEPLRSISTYGQLLQARYQGKLDADADEFIGYMTVGVTRMRDLIADLLAYSRVIHGRDHRMLPVSLDAILRQVMFSLRASLQESGATLEAGALPEVTADESQLILLLQNLLSNAVKYRRPDVPLKVYIDAERDGAMCRVSVRDNGIGFKPEYAEHIFRLFKRLHPRDRFEGTGIGLAICRRIVEQHGGRIWAESQPGCGAAFFFTLPV